MDMFGSLVDMLWLIGGHMVALIGGHVVAYWWTFVAHWWTFNGSLMVMWWLICEHAYTH